MLRVALLLMLLFEAAAVKLLDVFFRPGLDLRRDSARLLRSSSQLKLGGSVDVGYFFTRISLVCIEGANTCQQIFLVGAHVGEGLTTLLWQVHNQMVAPFQQPSQAVPQYMRCTAGYTPTDVLGHPRYRELPNVCSL